ncbi:MAG TPA: hypothetical protein VN577_04910 [Terriglobales bacterium]|nr:hypothetical protein [Terriglobales bacterium]
MSIIIPKTEPPPLTAEQRRALEQYASFEVGLDEVRHTLRAVMEFNFEAEKRWLNTHFLVPEPGIPITREHIACALSKKREGLITEKDLVYWATMLLMNEAYEFDQKDVDFIADWLNDISYDLDPTDDGTS